MTSYGGLDASPIDGTAVESKTRPVNGENMSEVVAGTDVSGNPGTVVLDLDGVVYVEHHGVPGAGDALRRLEDAGFTVLFATNNSTKTPASAAAAITEATGYSCRPEQVVSSSLVTARSIAGTHRRVLVVGIGGCWSSARRASPRRSQRRGSRS
jgi:ribonucleotide monophosphatase NagD (HAD superfamily)